MVYPNGDRSAHVSIVFDAEMIGRHLHEDGDATSEAQWRPTNELSNVEMSPFTRTLLGEMGVCSVAGVKPAQ